MPHGRIGVVDRAPGPQPEQFSRYHLAVPGAQLETGGRQYAGNDQHYRAAQEEDKEAGEHLWSLYGVGNKSYHLQEEPDGRHHERSLYQLPGQGHRTGIDA